MWYEPRKNQPVMFKPALRVGSASLSDAGIHRG